MFTVQLFWFKIFTFEMSEGQASCPLGGGEVWAPGQQEIPLLRKWEANCMKERESLWGSSKHWAGSWQLCCFRCSSLTAVPNWELRLCVAPLLSRPQQTGGIQHPHSPVKFSEDLLEGIGPGKPQRNSKV